MEQQFMDEAIRLSRINMEAGAGGPFGCVIVKNGEIIAKGWNQVTSSNDATAHAEVVAIREACKTLNSFQLEGCEIYTSCEPCPMCLGAIYWARPARVFFANTKQDAAAIEFDDQFIYEELDMPVQARSIPFIHAPSEAALDVFKSWADKKDKVQY